MHPTTLVSFLVLVLTLSHIPTTEAKCCRPDGGGDCADNSSGSPCCGYKRCNGFCCACPGVQLIRQPVDRTTGTYYYTVDSIITAPLTETWTCRQDHITRHPWTTPMPPDTLTKRTVGPVDPPAITAAPAFYDRRTPAELQEAQADNQVCDEILMTVSNGTGEVNLEQYLQYFNVIDKDSERGRMVIDKFHAHDVDGSGILTKEEIDLII